MSEKPEREVEDKEPYVSFDEYEKLQLEYIESQKELKEITELFEQ